MTTHSITHSPVRLSATAAAVVVAAVAVAAVISQETNGSPGPGVTHNQAPSSTYPFQATSGGGKLTGMP